MPRLNEIKPDEASISYYNGIVKSRPQVMPQGYERYNRDWFLTGNGDMNHVSDYPIEAERLDDDDWLLHLMEKRWFDANTFLPAYFEACHRAGIKTVEIITEY